MKNLLIAFCASCFAFMLFPDTSLAQQYNPQHSEEENMKVPDGWETRLDKPGKKATIGDDPEKHDIFFVNMSPGWHITTGPRAIFYRPEATAKGSYSVSTTLHLFDPKGRNEAFGLFLGGQNLQSAEQSYTYFLIRNSGEYLIKKRIGEETKVVKDWTEAPSMVTFEDTTETSVSNTLSVKVGRNNVSFFVNGEKVDTLPKEKVDTEGIVGLRVNHILNLHVQDINIDRQ